MNKKHTKEFRLILTLPFSLKHLVQKAVVALVFMLSFQSVDAQHTNFEKSSQKHFDGFLIGANLGYQNIFGGSWIDELDVLAQESKWALDVTPGYRKQFLNDRLVVGAELVFGIIDGDLSTIDQRNQLRIDYASNTQMGYGMQFGFTLGKRKRTMVYTYGQVIQRDFDVTITDLEQNVFMQEDGQKFGKYGLGIEMVVHDRLSITASAGRIAVDFGDKPTNIDVEQRIDINLGINIQF